MTQAPTPPPSTIERLGAMLVAIAVRISGGVSWGAIAPAAVAELVRRVNANMERIRRIAALILAGSWRLRRRATPAGATRRPRQASPPPPLPKTFGWLVPLLPRHDAMAYRGHLETLLAEPDIQALIAAAPAALGRPLRSLCWMFQLKPPPSLAPPRQQARKPAAPPANPPPLCADDPPAAAPPPAAACGRPFPA